MRRQHGHLRSDLLELGRDGSRHPCLIEIARAHGGDELSVGYVWSTGRIGATVQGDRVRIRRRFGVIGEVRGEGSVHLENGEEAFVAALAAKAWTAS